MSSSIGSTVRGSAMGSGMHSRTAFCYEAVTAFIQPGSVRRGPAPLAADAPRHALHGRCSPGFTPARDPAHPRPPLLPRSMFHRVDFSNVGASG